VAINTKDLIKSKLPSESVNTLSVPKPTDELANVESLNSKNLVDSDNQPLPSKIKDQKIAEGVDKNTPGIRECITQKVKDLAGIFTVSYGIPTIDQFSSSNVGGSFTTAFENIKTTFTDTIDGIKNVFKRKKQNNLDQVETGGLSLKKFLGCEEANVNFTSRERVQAQTQPEIITEKIDSGTKQSQEALADQANNNVEQRTQPPANKTKQVDVPIITEVEKARPIPWTFYNLRIYETPFSEPLTPEIKQKLKNVGLSVISTEKEGDELLLFAVKNINDNSIKYLYDIVSTKDKNPEIANYDTTIYEEKLNVIDSLPSGYLIVEFNAYNTGYSIDNTTGYYYSSTTFILRAKYTSISRFVENRYSDTLDAKFSDTLDSKFVNESSYIGADRGVIRYFIEGEKKPYGPKLPYFVTQLKDKLKL